MEKKFYNTLIFLFWSLFFLVLSCECAVLDFDLTPAGTQTSEWTQDGHDAQRTGCTYIEPSDPWTYKWSFNGPDSPPGSTSAHFYNAPKEARTCCGGGNIYIPATNQGLYARRLSDGTQVWRAQNATYNSTPAYDPDTGYVYAGATNGYVYKFLGNGNGIPAGSCNLGNPINKPVLLIPGAIFIVTDNGNLHKIRTSDMTLLWTYDAGAGSYGAGTPGAYSPSRNCVIYATNDLYVHAVNNDSTGTRKWRVKPTPNSPGFPNEFDGFYPVIAEQHGIVFVRMRLDHPSLDPFGGQQFPSTCAEIRTWLNSHPSEKNLFALDLDDGSEAFVPAVGYGGTEDYVNGSAYSDLGPPPVIKVWPNGDEVAYCHFRQHQSYPSADYRWDSCLGEMVLDNTTISGLVAGDLRFIQLFGYVHISDEQTPLTMAGSTIFNSHWGAHDSVRLGDRSASRGLTYSNAIQITKHVSVIQGGYTVSSPNTSTHYTTQGLNLCGDTRWWNGPLFWTYCNLSSYIPPGSPQSGAYSAGLLPRYAYVSGQYIIFEGNGGDIFVVTHSGTP